MANASLPGGGASDASRKVLPMKLVRDAVNSYRSVTKPLQVDSELEEDEDGLHIDFGDVSRTLLEACAESAKARRVDSDEKSSHSRRPPVFLDNYLLIEGHGRELLDESVEFLASDLPQGRQSAEEYQNLILGFVACGWKCPLKGCDYTVHPRSGRQVGREERDKAKRLEALTVIPMNRDDLIFDHWEQSHFPASYSSRLKAQCPYFEVGGLGCPTMCYPKVHDLKKHLTTVHEVVDVVQYGLADRCRKVMEEAPQRPPFVPFSEQVLTAAFARGLAVRTGAIANALLPTVETRKPRRSRAARKRVHTDSLGEEAAGSAAPIPQQQDKGPHVGENAPKRMKPLPVVPRVQPPAVEVGFKDVTSKRIRGGPHKRGKGGNPAPADINPRKHGVEVQKCNTLSSKTSRVPAKKVASTRTSTRADQARSQALSDSDRAKKVFVGRREELMRPFQAFGDRVRYLPSVPASVPRVSQAGRYENALLEMVDQSRAFLYRFAVQYADLLKTCRQENAPGMTLGAHYADDILAAVVARETLSLEDVETLAKQVVAQAAGSVKELAADVTPAQPTNLPPRTMNVIEVEPSEPILIGCVQQAPTPAASSLFLPKYVIPRLYSGVVSESAPASGSTSGGGKEERKSSMVTLGHIKARPPPPSASAATGTEAMEVADAASSSATTPSLARAPAAADVQLTVRGMLGHLTAMVDMLSSGPLASICVEEVDDFRKKCAKPPLPR